MSELIKCECCGKEVSDESRYCIYCGQPITEEKVEFLFNYIYDGQYLNSFAFHDDINKVQLLKSTGKVEVYDKNYIVKDIICSAHNDIVNVILDDYE